MQREGALASESEAASPSFSLLNHKAAADQEPLHRKYPITLIYTKSMTIRTDLWNTRPKKGRWVGSQGGPSRPCIAPDGLEDTTRGRQKSQNPGGRGRNKIRNKVKAEWGEVFNEPSLPRQPLPVRLVPQPVGSSPGSQEEMQKRQEEECLHKENLKCLET